MADLNLTNVFITWNNFYSIRLGCMGPCMAQRFQMTKNRRKIQKKICEIVWVILMLATIWQVSEIQRMQSPEAENMQICWNRFWKNSWNHNKWTYFWRVLVIWILCVWASKENPDGLVQVHFSIAVSEEQLIDKGWPMTEILSMSELSLLEVGTFPW